MSEKGRVDEETKMVTVPIQFEVDGQIVTWKHTFEIRRTNAGGTNYDKRLPCNYDKWLPWYVSDCKKKH